MSGSTEEQSVKRRTILVVEDDEATQTFMHVLFDKQFTLLTAPSAEAV